MSIEKLEQAVQSGKLEDVRALLEAGADISARFQGHETLLHIAASAGHVEVARLLIDRGIDVEALSEYGDPALTCATMATHLDMVSLLLERGADPNAASEESQTALHRCAEWGAFAYGADGEPLSEAAKQVYIDIAKRLLAAGADPNLPGSSENRPLHIALESAPIELATVLLDGGADPNIPGWSSRVPLEIALQGDPAYGRGHDHDKVRLLLERGADPKATTSERSSPILLAREIGDEALLALFGSAVADLPPPVQRATGTPGFDGVTRGFLIAGRTIDAELHPAELEALVAISARWAERLGQPIVCVPACDASPETGGLEPGETYPMMVTIGLVVVNAPADPGARIPDPVDIDGLRRAVARAAELPAELWHELGDASETDLVEDEDALWLVSCGPLAAASLVFGAEADEDDDSGLDTWQAVDQDQETMSPEVTGLCVAEVSYDGNATAACVDLSDDAHAGRLATTEAIASGPRGYYVLVSYD